MSQRRFMSVGVQFGNFCAEYKGEDAFVGHFGVHFDFDAIFFEEWRFGEAVFEGFDSFKRVFVAMEAGAADADGSDGEVVVTGRGAVGSGGGGGGGGLAVSVEGALEDVRETIQRLVTTRWLRSSMRRGHQ